MISSQLNYPLEILAIYIVKEVLSKKLYFGFLNKKGLWKSEEYAFFEENSF
jgi:hypothetical protein